MSDRLTTAIDILMRRIAVFSFVRRRTSGKMPGGGVVLPYMGYIGMRRCEGYGFQAVYSSIGYINQSVWV